MPMSRKTRRLLFYGSIAAFVLIGTGVLSLAFGLTYDFEEHRLVKTGSLTLQIDQPAEIFIDDNSQGKTFLLSNTFSKRGLLPGEYRIKVAAEGFLPWEKSFTIAEGLVTDFSLVHLIREKLPEENLIQLSELSRFNIQWLTASPYKKYFLYDGQQAGFVEIESGKFVAMRGLPKTFLNASIFWDDSEVYAAQIQKNGTKNMQSFNLENGQQKTVTENISTFQFTPDDLFFVSFLGQKLYRLGLNSHQLTTLPSLSGKSFGFLGQAETAGSKDYLLFSDKIYQADEQNLTLLVSNVSRFVLSPDKRWLAWINNHEIWTMPLDDFYEQPTRLAGESELLTRLSGQLTGLSWHRDSNALLYQLDDKLIFTEIDQRGGVNSYPLVDKLSSSDRWHYDPGANKILLWQSGTLKTVSLN